MAVSFNKDSVWNLTPISAREIDQDVGELFVADEKVLAAFRTIRDQLIFTNKRIIAIDVQGIVGKKKSYATMPFFKIQYFTVQTPGFTELVPDSELFLMFSNGFTATFEFKGNTNIRGIGRLISSYVLKDI